MKIAVTSVFVEDQQKALQFYTEVLGFVMKQDVPIGEDRWLTVVSPADPNGIELLLEPNRHPAAQAYQKALFADGIPVISFKTDDIEAEARRLKEHGVHFAADPTPMDAVITAVFDDTCGNLISLLQLV